VAFGSHPIADFGLGEGRVVADRYELGGVLGSGAETIVFRAHDFLTGDEIAVKVFRATALQNPAALKAFQRDLSVLRDDAHPNVVRVLDFGDTAGAFYVAMELIHGAPLSRHVAVGPGWSHDAALEVLKQVSSALEWLHSHQVAHGDIRTANIVWDDGAVKVMDFGPQRDSRQATRHAPISLCPYASPERLLGRPFTVASDLYSAAAVIFDLVVGERPHATASLVERATAEAPRVRDYAPDVPDGLARILERCLNPDPDLRPASAAEILEQCRRLRGETASPIERQMAGPALADRMGGQPLDVSEMSGLLLTICRVLGAIHEGDLAHSDLAPRNIGLPGGGQVNIATFPAPPPNATLMMTEPKYAAPEMLLTHTTSGGAVHTRSDIYVLGFVSYEALAGADAFRRQMFEPGGEPETDLFWMKWHADPAKRLKPLSDVNPAVPQELSSLIQRMIEKDSAARIDNLNDVECGLMQLRRRLETTDDIEVSSLSGSVAEAQPETSAVKRQWKALPYILLFAGLVVCGASALWWSGAGHCVTPLAADSFRWTKQKVTEARAVVYELVRRRPSTQSTPALASIIATATGPMVLVPAGRFTIGSSVVPNEAPAHTAYLPAFYIDQYEVSNGRYRAFTDSTGYSQPAAPSWDPDYFAKSSHPVLNVSWRDAQAFCIAAGKRLPTEAEWEKAARGSSPASRFWANWTVNGLANLKREGPGAPSPIGSFPADVSPFGAYDMAGNVHEWVNDQYGLYSGNSLLLDRTGAAKVVRGGSYTLAPPELSPSWRASLDPSITSGTDSPVGFRCAADPSPADGSGAMRQPISRPHVQSQP
jgi:formylglycine-generating enzyme required for sulfatase activity/serine/threonine protein kinase